MEKNVTIIINIKDGKCRQIKSRLETSMLPKVGLEIKVITKLISMNVAFLNDYN